MSVHDSRWAAEQRVGDPAAKLVLLILADLSDEDHCSCPSEETLMRVADQPASKLSESLRVLLDGGFIAKHRRRIDGRDGWLLHAPPCPRPARRGGSR